jgi:hypothetical protein
MQSQIPKQLYSSKTVAIAQATIVNQMLKIENYLTFMQSVTKFFKTLSVSGNKQLENFQKGINK